MEKGSNSSGFHYRSTAEEVTQGLNAAGITAIVTGTTSGIGTETARVLALRGAHVYLAGRSVESVAKVKESILKQIPDAKLDILAPMDLSSQASVRKSAESFLALDQPLSLLINNAGAVRKTYGLTEDGIEIQFGTNHIGPFLLTNLLLDKLKETANKTGIESKIINVSGMYRHVTKDDIIWKNINEDKSYVGVKSYGISKLANVYHAQELARRLQEEGVTNVVANSLGPGMVRTNLGRDSGWFAVMGLYVRAFLFWGIIPKTIPQGAATTCYAALHPSTKGVSGKFFANSSEFDPKTNNPLAGDEQAAKQLWEASVQLTSK